MAICVLEGQFFVLEDEPARKVAEVSEDYIVFHVEPEDKQKDEDDPYADFEVPDDLILQLSYTGHHYNFRNIVKSWSTLKKMFNNPSKKRRLI